MASFAYSVGETTISYPYDFPVGTTTVLAVVTDDSGLTSNCSFDVVVTDNIDPVITCPTQGLAINVDADECDHTGTFEATATDNCGVASFTYSVGGSAISYPYDFPAGTTSVLAVVTDDNGLTANCSFDVVVTDNIDPVITCPTEGLAVCLLYTSPSPRDATLSRMPSSA